MATDVTIGYGTRYEVFDEGTAGFVFISEVIDVSPGAEVADRVEATHMESPNRRREYVAGLIDNGEATFQINWVPGNDTDVLLRTLFESGDVVDHRVTFPNNIRATFEAAITGYEKAVPIDDRMTATITVAVSGATTWDTA